MGGENKSAITIFSIFLACCLLLSAMFFRGTDARRLSAKLHEDVFQEIEGVIKGLSLEEVKKSGPSPGIGHKYKNLQTLGVIKNSGPSPGGGHNVVNGNNP
ncbi:conserved hypothetical protein [Ricinus communis]|uniref:Transmembrane protein n=1 Tax=Ricinus communis TaxID=3988 RepID=B9RY88_RICCO|nr:conserved hypothetical protein [Ricinus communis]